MFCLFDEERVVDGMSRLQFDRTAFVRKSTYDVDGEVRLSDMVRGTVFEA